MVAELPTNQNVESTPLAIDGVLYLTLPWSRVVAVDGATGEQLWLYDPKVPGEWNINVCCGFDNRGAAAYEGKIIFGTLDERLIALDDGTGQLVWSVQATPEAVTRLPVHRVLQTARSLSVPPAVSSTCAGISMPTM